MKFLAINRDMMYDSGGWVETYSPQPEPSLDYPRKLTYYDARLKVEKALKSCVTLDQLKVACNLIEIFNKSNYHNRLKFVDIAALETLENDMYIIIKSYE
jgi:hypothetical protein